jgi:uncharacterized low-complexity protein
MSDRKVVKPIVLAVGAALAGSFAVSSSIASADTVQSPFAMSTLSAGYLLGAGEGSCGGDKEGKEKTEGSCGGDKEGKDKAEGSCGGDKEGEGHDKDGEGSCGEDKDAEGSCGGDKEGESQDKDAEGSCGEGSCGGDSKEG